MIPTWRQLSARAKRFGASIDHTSSSFEAFIYDPDGDRTFDVSCVGHSKAKRDRVLRASVAAALREMRR